MSDDLQAFSRTLPPHLQLLQMNAGSSVSRVLCAAAKLGLADHLADGPRSALELAGPLRLHAPSLHRLMRTLASLGILSEGEPQRFALTPLGAALKTNAPGSVRSALLVLGSDWMARAWDHFIYSLETGETGMEKGCGVPIFAYLAQHPEEASLFSETMVAVHGAEPPAVAAAYNFSDFGAVVDVGGATGNMLAAILARYPGPRGILFDRPHVVSEAPRLLTARGVEERVTIEPGDFFETVPAGGDVYILSHIIHDWNDEQCLAILANCRNAMKPGTRLLIVEMVLPDGDTPHRGKLLDMVMLAITGGQERTEAEYADLLRRAGFRLNCVVPTESDASVVEAVPA
jgi:hypothetical protein